MLKKNISLLLAAFFVASCSSSTKSIDRQIAGMLEKQAENFSDNTTAQKLQSAEISRITGSRNLKLVEGRVIIDNDAAFESKLEMIRNARKEIRMVYYIYGDDNSTSVLNAELIRKAQQGVKITLLADLITNYKEMDLFNLFETEGRGNIKVYFYNFPSDQIRNDAVYMTLPCPTSKAPTATECAQSKEALMAKMSKGESTMFSRLFLAGLYGKNPLALKIALGVGGGIDPKNYASATKTSDEDKAKIVEFLKLFKAATLDGDVGAKIKMTMALATYGETLNPLVNELTGRLPFGSSLSSASEHAQEWEHVTDYTHHKLLAVDGTEFQLGGRNLEDSYHMKNRIAGDGKYIFMDTDFYGRTAPGGTAEVERTYDRLVSFKGMITDLATIQKMSAYEMMANPEALQMAVGSCMQKQAANMGRCIDEQFPAMPSYKNAKARMVTIKANMQAKAEEYGRNYKSVFSDNWKGEMWKPGSDSLSANDLKKAEFFYVENLPFDKTVRNPTRNFGAKIGIESQYSKDIHALWYRGLENACYTSKSENRQVRVVFHTAYLLMPSGLIHKLAKMMNGDYGDCSRVRVTFLTNSFESTDLNVINVFARYQLKEVFQYQARIIANHEQVKANIAPRPLARLFPTIDYFEYNAAAAGAGVSLHTKLTVLGDDVLVGSANADTRSYYMDSNNGLLIRNATDFNKAYLAFVDSIIADNVKTKPMTKYFSELGESRIDMENRAIMAAMLARWDKKGRAEDKHKQMFLNLVNNLGNRLAGDTRKILDYRQHLNNARLESPKAVTDVEAELNSTANAMDDLFKLL